MMSVEGWNDEKLVDLLELIRNGYSGKQVDKFTDYPVTRIETISDGVIDFDKIGFSISIPDSYKLQDGDILLSNINSLKHIGKIAQFSGENKLYHGMNLLLLRFKAEINNKFIYYKLIQSKIWFEKVATQAVNQASINQETIHQLIIEIPQNTQEQHQIVAVLSTIDLTIAHTEAIIAKQQRIKTGLMQDLLTKGIDENGNIRSEETHEFKDSPLGRIPAEWEVSPVSKYGSKYKSYLRTGPFGTDLNSKHWVEYGIPVLTIGCLGEGEIIESELLHISDLKAKNMKGFSVDSGDIVFSRVADIGRSLVIQPQQKGWIISSNLMRLSLDIEAVEPVFLYRNIAFNSSVHDQLRISCNSGGRDLVNGQILASILFPFPSQQEQIRINGILDHFDTNLSGLNKELTKLSNQKTGLMQDLLTGKVRVTEQLKDIDR